MHLIAPMAGLSTRYPGKKPKYLWPTHQGVPLFVYTLQDWIELTDTLYVGILAEHEEQWSTSSLIRSYFPAVHIHVIPHVLPGPAATIEALVKEFALSGPTCVRDVDAAFIPDGPLDGNRVACIPVIPEAGSAFSYLMVRDFHVSHIVEKPIVPLSTPVCCGGWVVEDAQYLIKGYKKRKGEIYMSDVVNNLIQSGVEFHPLYCKGYENYNTYQSWKKQKDSCDGIRGRYSTRKCFKKF